MVYGMTQRHDADLRDRERAGQGHDDAACLFASAQGAAAVSREGASQAMRSLRILIIDDDPLLLRSVRDTLEAEGHDIEAANGGQAGINAFAAAQARGAPFEFVFTDLGMPHIDGRKVAAAIKGLSAQTPVVMLTGWGQRLLATHDLPEHVDRVLSKPPKIAELRQVMRDLA